MESRENLDSKEEWSHPHLRASVNNLEWLARRFVVASPSSDECRLHRLELKTSVLKETCHRIDIGQDSVTIECMALMPRARSVAQRVVILISWKKEVLLMMSKRYRC